MNTLRRTCWNCWCRNIARSGFHHSSVSSAPALKWSNSIKTLQLQNIFYTSTLALLNITILLSPLFPPFLINLSLFTKKSLFTADIPPSLQGAACSSNLYICSHLIYIDIMIYWETNQAPLWTLLLSP